METLLTLDRQLFLFLNTFISHPLFDVFFLTITDAHSWIVPLIIIIPLFIFKERKKAVLVIVLALLTVAATDLVSARVLKPLFGRLRPCHPDILIEGCHYLEGRKRSFSFPSSHATNMFGQAIIFSFFYSKHIPIFFAFAGLIGFSRIYTGVHYPGDIIGGLFFGTIIAFIVLSLYKYLTVAVKRIHRVEQQNPYSSPPPHDPQ